MASNTQSLFKSLYPHSGIRWKLYNSPVLVVGAGGVGCEVIKNLVLCGFHNLHIIDLDTIELSNLNRQFLFHAGDVGKSKAEVAAEVARSINKFAPIKHYHKNIMSPEFDYFFFKQFMVVVNALDNRAARSHVNRMCILTDVYLIETGTAGYEGQVEFIKKNHTACYDCTPKPPQKTYASCTIRNTPSELIHCIVWSKHLFNQLFGLEDPNENVSPDTNDPEAAGSAGQMALESEMNEAGNITRKSTRAWANECDYDPEKLFAKLFHHDIKYLLSMSDLWKNRTPPTPLDWKNLPDEVPGCSRDTNQSVLRDQECWSISKCADIFATSINSLKKELRKQEDKYLIWSKEFQPAMDFVTAASNIRAYIFGIPQKSRFDIKSMAGNIIPAIATANAIIAGLAALHVRRLLLRQSLHCVSVYLRSKLNHYDQLLVSENRWSKPNNNCVVCRRRTGALHVRPFDTVTLRTLRDVILKDHLKMITPEVVIESTGAIVISSEEGETDDNLDKTLKEMKFTKGMILLVDDYGDDKSKKSSTIAIYDDKKGGDGPESPIFEIDDSDLNPKNQKEEDDMRNTENSKTSNGEVHKVQEMAEQAVKRKIASTENGSDENEGSTAKKSKLEDDIVEEYNANDDDDICIVESDVAQQTSTCQPKSRKSRKRKTQKEDVELLFSSDDDTDMSSLPEKKN